MSFGSTRFASARQRFWKNWLLTFAPGMVTVYVVVGLAGPDDGDVLLDRLVGVLIGVVVAGALLFLAARSRAAILPEPPLTAGLPRAQRRAVGRDLRRGQPNADPVLREVERRFAQRYRRSGQVTVWLAPLAFIAAVAWAIAGTEPVYRVLAVAVAVLLAVATVQQWRTNRGFKAFGP